MMKSQLITFIWSLTLCDAFRPKIGFHSEPNCTGDGLILGSKRPNLISLAPEIISTSQSYSISGVWGLYQSINYNSTDGGVSINVGPYYTACWNTTDLQLTKSARYLGPPDTITSSISLYEITLHRGREVTITGPASNNIPFIPQSLFTTGHTSWTLYNGSDFDGTATCFIPWNGDWYHRLPELNSTLSNVRSVLRGCDRHIDYYIYGNGQPEKTLLAR